MEDAMYALGKSYARALDEELKELFKLAEKSQLVGLMHPMQRKDGTRMDTKLLTVGSKWLVTKDAEGHKAGDILEIDKFIGGYIGEFTVCRADHRRSMDVCRTDHRHSMDWYLRPYCHAMAVPLRDEAFWGRYEPKDVFDSKGVDSQPPKPGEVAIWCSAPVGNKHWSVWVGMDFKDTRGQILRLVSSTKQPFGQVSFSNATGYWRTIQAPGQAEPTPPEQMGYELAAQSEFIKKVDVAIETIRQANKAAMGRPLNTFCLGADCKRTAVPGAKKQLCEQHITQAQLAADTAQNMRWYGPQAPHHGEQPQSHATLAGGFFTLSRPTTKPAWKYPEVDDYDLLPDA